MGHYKAGRYAAGDDSVNQPSLFSAAELQGCYSVTPAAGSPITPGALAQWKQRIWQFQQQVQRPSAETGSAETGSAQAESAQAESAQTRLGQTGPSLTGPSQTGPTQIGSTQTSLFEVEAGGFDPADSIEPFTLPRQNTEFWRWRADDAGVAALYFVIDYDLPILLYVGETVKSNQRWKGEHDCKRYLLNYRQVHYQHGLPSSLGIGFWPHAPAQTRPRQALELALIQKWRAPFNKENWRLWGTPFVQE